MKLLDEKGLTTVWAAIKNTFTSKSDADGKYAKKSEIISNLTFEGKNETLQGQLCLILHETKKLLFFPD